MRTLIWIVVALVVVAVIVLAVMAGRRRRRAEELRGRFGREYDRAVDRAGSTRQAQAQLEDVARRRDRLTVTEVSPTARARFDEAWLAVQTRFVDEPGQAVTDADGLVTAVMRARGYPVEDFEERAWMLAADHGDVVDHYRRARAAHTRHLETGRADTEDLRQAFVHYRLLYGVLTGRPGGQGVTLATASSGAHAADGPTIDDAVLLPGDRAPGTGADRAAVLNGGAADGTDADAETADRVPAGGSPRMGGYRTAAERVAAERAERIAAERDQGGA